MRPFLQARQGTEELLPQGGLAPAWAGLTSATAVSPWFCRGAGTMGRVLGPGHQPALLNSRRWRRQGNHECYLSTIPGLWPLSRSALLPEAWVQAEGAGLVFSGPPDPGPSQVLRLMTWTQTSCLLTPPKSGPSSTAHWLWVWASSYHARPQFPWM